MYLLGVEGGVRKTHCVIGDENGNIFAEGFGGSANYDCVGQEQAKQSIQTAIHRALDKLSIKISDIQYAVFGLSGADYPEDFEILNNLCQSILENVPFLIFNDCYIALLAGSEENWGIVSVCGAGHGVLGKGKNGTVISLRNMDYELGNRGGGDELVREALHYAFRADENVMNPTKLQIEIPKLFHVNTMKEVDEIIRNEGSSEEVRAQLPLVVMNLAKQRDKVAQSLVINMGRAMGQSAASVLRKMGNLDEKIPVIMAGNVFCSDCSILHDAYRLEIHKIAPNAKLKILDKKPVFGAYYLAIDEFNKSIRA